MIVVSFVPICSFSIRNISFLVPSKTDVFKNERVAGGETIPAAIFTTPTVFFSTGVFYCLELTSLNSGSSSVRYLGKLSCIISHGI